MRFGDAPLPAFGENAFVRFTSMAFEELEALIGADYSLALLIDRILGGDIPLIVAALSASLHDADAGAARVTHDNIGEVSGALVDAILLSWYGRTAAEQAAHEERA